MVIKKDPWFKTVGLFLADFKKVEQKNTSWRLF